MKKFNYQKICADLLKDLPQRTASVIERRFGLKGGQRETLEAIGETNEITRERVRQIEEEGLSKIRPKIQDHPEVFKYFKKVFASFGGVKKEEELLEILGGAKFPNQVFFLLANNQDFKRITENNEFYTLWTLDKGAISKAKKLVKSTTDRLKKEKRTFSLQDLLDNQKLNKNVFISFIGTSKEIQKNPEGKYGLKDWLEINPRGVKDKAYLVLKRKEKPLHFAEIASLIGKLPFPGQGKVHLATVHNELIKDQRFVLVGRGLYALREWGYTPGVVKDVIIKTLKESKRPLTKQEILDKVLKERFVKANTVVLNLHNGNYFLRDEKGRYKIREA